MYSNPHEDVILGSHRKQWETVRNRGVPVGFCHLIIIIIIIIYSHTRKHAHIETIPYTCVNWIIRPQVTLIITQK